MIVVRMLLSNEVRTVTSERAKHLIETKQAVPAPTPNYRCATVPNSQRERR